MLDEGNVPEKVNLGQKRYNSAWIELIRPGECIFRPTKEIIRPGPGGAGLAQSGHSKPAQPGLTKGAWRGNPGQAGFS
jgi:hypothetical protein